MALSALPVPDLVSLGDTSDKDQHLREFVIQNNETFVHSVALQRTSSRLAHSTPNK